MSWKKIWEKITESKKKETQTKDKKETKKEEDKRVLRTLILKDVIETLVSYNIEHTRFPHNYIRDYIGEDIVPEIHGLAIDDKKLILIDKEQCVEDIRETVIHELIHTKHYRKGDLKGREIEDVVKKETELTYKELYGVEPW